MFQPSSHVSTWYFEISCSTVSCSFSSTSLLPNPAFLHLLLQCIAAKSSGEIFRLRGSNRSPSSLKTRSHSQLEAGIESTSSASLLRLGYRSCSPTQYFVGNFALSLPASTCGSRRFHISNSSSLSTTLFGSIRLLIASSILLILALVCVRGFSKLQYCAHSA